MGKKTPPRRKETSTAQDGVVQVEVICEGVLGPRRLTNGAITADHEYVALLDDPRDLVRAVGESAPAVIKEQDTQTTGDDKTNMQPPPGEDTPQN